MSATLLNSENRLAVAPRDIVVFDCPSCGHSLRVPRVRAHESGPCPVCAASISAPGSAAGRVPVAAAAGMEMAVPLRREARSFVAHRVIMPGADVPLDDSWKQRYAENLRAWRRRKDFEKKVSGFFEGRLWRRIRNGGLLTLMAILVGSVLFLYSAKKTGLRNEGIFDAFQKTEVRL